MTLQGATLVRRRAATAAAVGVVVYVLVDVVLQLLPPHYSAVSDAESNLAVGPFGWIMNLNFLGRAALTLCAVVAIVHTGPSSRLRRAGTGLMMVAGACSAALAVLPTDVNAGGGIQSHTILGAWHLGVAAFGFLAALAAFSLLTIWIRGSADLKATYPAALGLTAVAAGGLVALGLAAAAAPSMIGLVERICLAGILGWALVVSLAIRWLR